MDGHILAGSDLLGTYRQGKDRLSPFRLCCSLPALPANLVEIE